MDSDSCFKYDVAFSFLRSDLHHPHKLAADLDPTVSTFVYDRRKEELIGNDGMDRFAEVFGHEVRLTVILYRDGWDPRAATAKLGPIATHSRGEHKQAEATTQ